SMAAQNSNTSYAKYRFPYSAGRQEEGYYSFRIKQVSPAGLVLYSPVRSVLLEAENEISYQTAPNPAGKSVNISFYKPVSGNYQIELVNMSGQVLYQHQYRLINQYNIHVEWSAPIPKGLYFLRVKDQQQALQKMTKLLLN
ncbi:MAG TPA: T9SS type A sorting domain-containing protein, partial [Chitinophagaceae bacterium]|nr:T9SS type A sorting domain-containing protein [Chitinophagaceae bacterium]